MTLDEARVHVGQRAVRRFVLVRHRYDGGRDELASFELAAEDGADINRGLVRTMYRLWPSP